MKTSRPLVTIGLPVYNGLPHLETALKTLLAQDYENGRPLEIEAIIGNAVRIGRRLGVATPTLEAIYALARMVAAKSLG